MYSILCKGYRPDPSLLLFHLQTQYTFIHNALDELLTCGETEIAAANMRVVIGKLRRVVSQRKAVGFHVQLEVMLQYSVNVAEKSLITKIKSNSRDLANFSETKTATEHAQYHQNRVWACSVAVFTFAEFARSLQTAVYVLIVG